jgi:hypothetical protein
MKVFKSWILLMFVSLSYRSSFANHLKINGPKTIKNIAEIAFEKPPTWERRF